MENPSSVLGLPSPPSSSDFSVPMMSRQSKKRERFTYVMKSLITLVVLIGAYTISVIFQPAKGVPPFAPLPIVTSNPAERCIVVDATLIHALNEERRWQLAYQSMLYHLDVEQLEGISAFHLGEPYCFMLLRSVNTTIAMFNPRFKGYSPSSVVTRDEQSMSCPTVVRTPKRSNHVLMTYIDACTLEEMLVVLTDREAWAAQHVGLHSMGYSLCNLHQTNTDNGVDTLRQLITKEINQ